jgi:hypothetical protein
MVGKIQITVPSYAFVYDKSQLRKVMRAAGAEVASVARALIRRATQSVPGGPPMNRTGVLARSLKVKSTKSGEGVTVRDAAFYALFLEAGAKGGGGSTVAANMLPIGPKRSKPRMKASAVNKTRVLLPHPFLSTALEMREDSIADRVRDAVQSGLKFQRIKA